MRITNTHERQIEADPPRIGTLMATMGQPDDALYPPLWDPMVFDGPIAVGASGTHGTISAYRPGDLLEITFPSGMGITGTHAFTISPTAAGRSLVRHHVDAEATFAAWLAWHLVIRASHDPVLEQTLDRLQTICGTPPERPARLSPYSRLLRRLERARARAIVAVPTELLARTLPRADHTSAHAIDRRRETPDDPATWARAIWDDTPGWLEALFAVRERLVRMVSIDSPTPATLPVLARTDHEVVQGIDASHLSFRTSVRGEPGQIVVTSLVQLHNRRGRAYFALIRHIHPVIMRSLLTRGPPSGPGGDPANDLLHRQDPETSRQTRDVAPCVRVTSDRYLRPMVRTRGGSYVCGMARTDPRSLNTSRAEHTARRPLWRQVLTAVLVVIGVYLALRAAVEPFLINYGDPSDYAADWGGPSLIGVLAVHMLPGIISAVLLTLWWRRRSTRAQPGS